MTDSPDADLLEQFARDHSETAFAALVERHIGLVHSVALRHTANPQHAQDITQAVFIILARKAATLNRKTILAGWLHHTARLTAANFQRAEFRRIRREQEVFMQSTLNESAPDALWPELSPLLDEAMSRLRTGDRDALVLRYFQNKNLAEVGAAMGLAERAAQKRVLRAIEKLRMIFTKHGVTNSADKIAETISTHSVQAVSPALVKAVTATAITKGATASTSILTLTKGALKIMAWTKMKTAIAIGVTAIIGVGYFSFFHKSHPNQTGKLNLPVGEISPAICLGRTYGIILASDGSLWAWGENDLGWPTLGLGDIKNTPVLNRIGNENDWVSIAAGSSHTLALKNDGTIWGWGSDISDALGNHTNVLGISRNPNSSSTPIPSVLGSGWKQIAAGYEDSFGIKDDGILWAWGLNDFGQLGIGTTKSSAMPMQVGSATWEKVWVGGTHTAGIQSDGTLWIWGNGAFESNTIPSRTT